MPYEPFASSKTARRRMQTLAAGRDTAPELALRKELWRRGHRYRVDHSLGLPNRRRRADLAFLGGRVAVFVDGCYWHGCPEHCRTPQTNESYWARKLARNSERDRETDWLARQSGWTVVRVWEHEDPVAAADRVEAAVRQAG